MFWALGGAEAGAVAGIQSGVYVGVTGNDLIVVTPFAAATGTYSYSIDPVNGNAIDETYGVTTKIPDNPPFLLIPFMFRFTAAGGLVGFDTSVSIAELGDGSAGGSIARNIELTNSEALQILDDDGDLIGGTAGAYVAENTDYWMLWYVDLRSGGAAAGGTRDILWVWKSGAWDKAVDVTDHGEGSAADIDVIVFGTSQGKGLPTEGGPFYVDEMAVQVLNVSPNTTPLGSVTTRFKVPKANGTDGAFNTGTGINPDWNDVDEIPPDGATTHDEGDVVGDKQSYEPNDATANDTPLAIQVIGQGGHDSGSAPSLKSYILEGGTHDYGDAFSSTGPYRVLKDFAAQPKCWNEINGQTITEALFNTIEVGVELIALPGGGAYQLSQIGAEYIVDGPKALPTDFPRDVLGVAFGSENIGIY